MTRVILTTASSWASRGPWPEASCIHQARLRGGQAVQGPPRRADHAAAGRAGLRRRRARHPRPRHRGPRRLAHLFATFEATGSATACVKAFRAAGPAVPLAAPQRPAQGRDRLEAAGPPHRAAGTAQPPLRRPFTYGRQPTTSSPTGRPPRRMLPRQEWISFIPGAHPGYITLDQYDANLARLTANAAAHGRGPRRRAAPRRPRAAAGHHHLRPLRAADDRPLPRRAATRNCPPTPATATASKTGAAPAP